MFKGFTRINKKEIAALILAFITCSVDAIEVSISDARLVSQFRGDLQSLKNTGAQVTYYGYEDIGIKEGVSFAKPVLVTSVDDASWCLNSSESGRFKNDASAMLFGLLVANDEIQRCGSYTPISGRVYGLSGLEYEPYRVIDIGALEYRSGTSLQVKGVRSDESFGSHDVLGINDDLSLNPTGDVAADNIWRVSSLYLAVMQLSKPVAERVPLSECESIAGGFTCDVSSDSLLAKQGRYLQGSALACDACTERGKEFLLLMGADLLYRSVGVSGAFERADECYLLSGDTGEWGDLKAKIGEIRSRSMML